MFISQAFLSVTIILVNNKLTSTSNYPLKIMNRTLAEQNPRTTKTKKKTKNIHQSVFT